MSKVKRSYNQYCGVAKALDIIGERWTLLIVRDLLIGPKRFKDLLDCLPGIGTNLLSSRLKELEQNGIIKKDTLPPPAGSSVYILTERGKALEDTLTSLVKWGITLLDSSSEEDFFNPTWIMYGMKIYFRPSEAQGVNETYEFRIDGIVFHVLIQNGALYTSHGSAITPDLIIETDTNNLVTLMRMEKDLTELVDSGDLKFQGDKKSFARLLDICGPYQK